MSMIQFKCLIEALYHNLDPKTELNKTKLVKSVIKQLAPLTPAVNAWAKNKIPATNLFIEKKANGKKQLKETIDEDVIEQLQGSLSKLEDVRVVDYSKPDTEEKIIALVKMFSKAYLKCAIEHILNAEYINLYAKFIKAVIVAGKCTIVDVKAVIEQLFQEDVDGFLSPSTRSRLEKDIE